MGVLGASSYHIFVAFVFVINLVKDLKVLTPFSTVSNIFTVFGFTLLFFYIIETDVEVSEDQLYLKDIQEVPVFVGITLFALEAVGVVLALEYNMDDPKKFLGLFGLFNKGMAVILIMYTLMGVLGFLKYGYDIEASITLNLPKVKIAHIFLAKLTTEFVKIDLNDSSKRDDNSMDMNPSSAPHDVIGINSDAT
ncbi:Proton-coupled amino acid transporter-like protein CG1139 [Eumeta japonica]|uniref:Proton-coupled amino acid transporter-like protein CG1139 n=1 Tax=Eumeta variegata TaxID=151549 RepID=A0A4C1SQH5_EUMVA|nr:Proton-coupled amino acid transporter-like protein CG1139 [Eumeta japonica]